MGAGRFYVLPTTQHSNELRFTSTNIYEEHWQDTTDIWDLGTS